MVNFQWNGGYKGTLVVFICFIQYGNAWRIVLLVDGDGEAAHWKFRCKSFYSSFVSISFRSIICGSFFYNVKVKMCSLLNSFFIICLLLKHFVLIFCLKKCGNQCWWYLKRRFAKEPQTRIKQIFTDGVFGLRFICFDATHCIALHRLQCWYRIFAATVALKTFGRMNSIARTVSYTALFRNLTISNVLFL